jgi:hypothetical protein
VASMTYYVALPFDDNGEGDLVAGEAQECQTATAAIRRAQSMSKVNAGAVAFSRRGDPSTGDFEAAEVIGKFGQVPAEEALLGYE